MPGPRRTPPDGYLEIERAIVHLERGEDAGWARAAIADVASGPARQARLLRRRGERRRAQAVLERELARLAGPESGSGLAWFLA